jgi:hypothetical protein
MTEAMRYARTLVEAYLYVSLAVSVDEPGDEMGDHRSRTTLTEGENAWTLRYDGPGDGQGHRIKVLVRYDTEAAARRDDLTFGSGTSELLDAGQWVQVSALYARRALREGFLFAQDPTGDDRVQGIVEGWRLAREMTIEALKFLPEGSDEIPAAAFWTEMGTSARQESPDRFTRERLESDIAFYEENLDDFRQSHG